MKHIESSKIKQIKVGGVKTEDYPDFVDSYVESCTINGRTATKKQLNYINSNMSEVAQEAAFESLLD
jgi:hypothetical protein